MPTVNVYIADARLKEAIVLKLLQFRELLARELTAGERALAPDEIRIRLVSVDGVAMIAPIEIEIVAHAYGDRIPRADKTCLLVRDFVMEQVSAVRDVRVWLILAELGHSWEE